MESASVPRREVPGRDLPGRAPGREPAAEGPVGWKPADPGPLGLGAFALTTFVLSMFNANLVSHAGEPVVLGLALAYGGIVQILAGMWEFRTGNTFGAVAFSSFGGFWISFWVLVTFFADKIPAEHLGSALGLYLIAWGIFTTYMFVASLRTTAAIALVFVLLAATYFLLGIGNANESEGLIEVGGWFGIATAAAAWYASFAAVVNSTFGRTLMPVKPLNVPRATEPAARD
ncbi:MAG TPA: acetate uptake transporter [Solirubrobacterales bacterium]|nr:acetate uptake transporter [Solirubrobacterales bacterium]